MSAYILAQIDIHDREQYAKYVEGFRECFGRYKGRVVVADEAPQLLEGQWPWTRTAVIRFDDEQEAVRWYRSDDYQAAARYRFEGATTNLVLVRGLD